MHDKRTRRAPQSLAKDLLQRMKKQGVWLMVHGDPQHAGIVTATTTSGKVCLTLHVVHYDVSVLQRTCEST